MPADKTAIYQNQGSVHFKSSASQLSGNGRRCYVDTTVSGVGPTQLCFESGQYDTKVISTADFNGDGLLDLYVGNVVYPIGTVPAYHGARDELYKNNGDVTTCHARCPISRWCTPPSLSAAFIALPRARARRAPSPRCGPACSKATRRRPSLHRTTPWPPHTATASRPAGKSVRMLAPTTTPPSTATPPSRRTARQWAWHGATTVRERGTQAVTRARSLLLLAFASRGECPRPFLLSIHRAPSSWIDRLACTRRWRRRFGSIRRVADCLPCP
jgi:hypothetical protein